MIGMQIFLHFLASPIDELPLMSFHGPMKCRKIFLLCATLLLASCASYVTPGGPANLKAITEPSVKKSFDAKPAIHFPANLALVRVQDGGYRSPTANGVGRGAYSVLTKRDIEKESDIDTLSRLPGVAGVVTLNRLLVPADLSTDVELREAAAKLHADAILLYTIATEFHDRDVIAPLTTLSLGLAPNTHYKIQSSASAVLIDTKTGFVYGALEEDADRSGLTISWGSSDVIDAARKKAEREALDKLLANFGPFWDRIKARYH